MIHLRIDIQGEEKALLEVEKIATGLSGPMLAFFLKSTVVPYLQRITEASWPEGRLKRWPEREKEVPWPLMYKTGELKGRLGSSGGNIVATPTYAQVTFPSAKDVRDKYIVHQLGLYYHRHDKEKARPMVGLLPQEEMAIIGLVENYVTILTR